MGAEFPTSESSQSMPVVLRPECFSESSEAFAKTQISEPYFQIPWLRVSGMGLKNSQGY